MPDGAQCPKRNAPSRRTQAIFPLVLDGHGQPTEMKGRLEMMRAELNS